MAGSEPVLFKADDCHMVRFSWKVRSQTSAYAR